MLLFGGGVGVGGVNFGGGILTLSSKSVAAAVVVVMSMNVYTL
jgi:hypothetical protein